MTGRWHGLVIDTPDPRGLATFYQELLGFVRVQDEDHWVVIGDAADRPGLAFQLAPDLQPPGWPGGGPPQRLDRVGTSRPSACRIARSSEFRHR